MVAGSCYPLLGSTYYLSDIKIWSREVIMELVVIVYVYT
jgi:hypothetical protein